MDSIEYFIDFLVNNLISLGPLVGFLIIFIESIIPILPLGFFIALNITSFGFIAGFIISWIATCLGCLLSFKFFRYLYSNKLHNFMKKSKFGKNIVSRIDKMSNISFANLATIMALPFTPAFILNIAAGCSNISKKKFIISVLIGKLFIVYFWGYVGKNLIQSMTDIGTIINICILLAVAYTISKIVDKKFNIN